MRVRLLLHLIVAAALIVACQPRIPREALELGAESLQQRQVQTRLFETDDETKVLIACSGLLQDLGFNIEEAESGLGVIVGSKDRSAVQPAQVIGTLILAAFFHTSATWDKNQKMKASVITRPIGEKQKRIAVRVTFQRIVWNNANKITKREGLTEPEIYQEFFQKLSKSLFLEAQEAL